MADPIRLTSDGGVVIAMPVCTNDPTTEPESNDIALFYFKKGIGPRVKMFGASAESFYLAATASADDAILEVRRGAANGVASLDAATKVPNAQISEVLAIADLSDVAAKTGSGTTVVFSAAPTLANPRISTSIVPTADNGVDIGGATLRIKSLAMVSGGLAVYNTVSAANAVLTLGNASITLGAGGGTAQDTRIYRSAGNTITIDNAAGGAGNLTVMGNLTVQGTTTTVNSTVVDIADRVIHVNHSTGSATAVPALMTGFSVHRGAVAGTSRAHAACVWVNDSDVVDPSTGTGYFQFCANSLGDDSTVGTSLALRCGAMTVQGSITIGASGRLILDQTGLGSACTFTFYNKGGEIVTLDGSQTLTNKTLTTPTISATGWTNANHAHTAANSGGVLGPAAIGFTTTGSGTVMVLQGNPVITSPTIADLSNMMHVHQSAGSGGQLTGLAFSDKTGSGTTVVLSGNPTITAPIIGTFVNSTHNHTNAAGGGTLTLAAFGTLGSGNQMMGMNGSGTVLQYKTFIAGTNVTVTHASGQITFATITNPTISDFSNAQHGHAASASGGQLNPTACFAATTGSGTTVVLSGNPTLTAPGIASFVNATHTHAAGAGGGQLTPSTCFAAVTGSGSTVVLSGNPTITAPVIGSFVNSTHTHQNNAGGGQLTGAVFSDKTGSGTTVVLSSAPTLVNPRIANILGSFASGGTLTLSAGADVTSVMYLQAKTGTNVANINQYGLGVVSGVATVNYIGYFQSNQNDVTCVGVKNTSTETAGMSAFIVLNSGTYGELAHTSTGYTTSGLKVAAQTFLLGTGAGGLLLQATGGKEIFDAVAASSVYYDWNLAGTSFEQTWCDDATNGLFMRRITRPSGTGAIAAYAFYTSAYGSLQGQVMSTGTAYTPAGGLLADDFAIRNYAQSSLSLITYNATPIRLVTGTAERCRILADANTLQFYGGGTIQGGAANGASLTLVGSATNHSTNKVSVAGSNEILAFFGGTGAVKQTVGDWTNNVTSGGTDNQADTWTDLSTYATDAAAIRNAVYQLARKVEQINDALRTSYGVYA